MVNLDSLNPGGVAHLNKDFLLSTNGSTNTTLAFPILEKGENKQVNLLRIYNNLGQIVFEQKAYQNDWEGQHQSGHKLVAGTYFYSLTFGKQQPHYQSGKIVYTP